VPGRVGEDPPPVAARLELGLGGAQLQHQRLGLVEVVDREVEVELLWHALVGPARRPVAIDPLEADPEPVLAGECGEIVIGLGTSSSPVAC
jgi:hypothetical protein